MLNLARNTLYRSSTITRTVHTGLSTGQDHIHVDQHDHNTDQVAQEVNLTNETSKYNDYTAQAFRWSRFQTQNNFGFDDGHNYEVPQKTTPAWGMNHGEEY